jgi:nicotinate-nucleotide pyrophosphorylase (carboxylating)
MGRKLQSDVMAVNQIPQLFSIQFRDVLRRALAEDLGRGGDLTTDAVIASEANAAARVFARQAGRVAGVDIAAAAFEMLDAGIACDVMVRDGHDVDAGDVVLGVEGSVRVILAAERTSLNFLGHLSGVATHTKRYVDAISGADARIVCTRKTTPGLRALEKYAVRCGGGANHRFGLDDAVLIKDNHLAAAGSVRIAVERARARVGHTVKVELEVDDLEQLGAGLDAGVDAVLLDNMAIEQLRRAVELVDGRAITEASGGITLDNVAEVAATGVDLISVGALTHSAPSLDVSLELDLG